jgi:6-pyruvoyltetrahydropterin 2'-reductase
LNIIPYSEIFHSPQGEGAHTGRNTLWLRYWSCNLQCQGFGQKDPTNPETYLLPYKDFDPKNVNRLEDLPVWKYGCDSSYTWAKKFKHLTHQDTPDNLARKLMDLITSERNPEGTFLHDGSKMETELCFTGGEPLLPANQTHTINLLRALEKYPGGFIPGTNKRKEHNIPRYITFETNGTQRLSEEFVAYFRSYSSSVRLLFSVSPKLFTVSGEQNEKAIKPDIVASYSRRLSSKGYLKFVVGTEDRQWEEMEEVIAQYRKAGVNCPIWVMPAGGQLEDQKDIAAEVADEAIKRGYHFSARVHCYVYGNVIGK